MRWNKIEVYPSFVLLLCILVFLDVGTAGLCFLVSAALHEGGHLVAMRVLHVPFYGMELHGTGAVIHTGNTSPGKEALCAAAGPAVNLLLFMLTFRYLPGMALANGILLFWNLLPLYPLDGGRLINIAIAALFGVMAADRISRALNLLLAITVTAFGVWQTCVCHTGLYPCLFASLFLCKAANTPCKICPVRLK